MRQHPVNGISDLPCIDSPICLSQPCPLNSSRLTNVSDFSSTAFHPCEAGGNETVPTLFSENGATCDDHFFKVFDDPETLLTGKHGSFLIMVSRLAGTTSMRCLETCSVVVECKAQSSYKLLVCSSSRFALRSMKPVGTHICRGFRFEREMYVNQRCCRKMTIPHQIRYIVVARVTAWTFFTFNFLTLPVRMA